MRLEFWQATKYPTKYARVEYQPRNKWLKIPFKMVQWLIGKVGEITLPPDECIERKLYVIEMDKVYDIIHKSDRAIQQFHDKRCQYMVLGRKQMEEVMEVKYNDPNMLCVRLDKAYMERKAAYSKDRPGVVHLDIWHGMDIIFVPWIDDIIIPLPEFQVYVPPKERGY